MVTFDILTIFPAIIEGYLGESIIKREILKKTITVRVLDIRSFSKDKHKKVDDRPYGGGAGMLMTPQPLFDAIAAAKKKNKGAKVIYLSPGGTLLTHAVAQQLADEISGGSNEMSPAADSAALSSTSIAPKKTFKRLLKKTKPKKGGGLILLCGRYEGIDERIKELCIDGEISIGEYVLSGGELPALVLLEAITRLLPGALGDERSAHEDSFSPALDGKKEYPHYTRPPEFKGLRVPEVLIEGDHKKIDEWRKKRLK